MPNTAYLPLTLLDGTRDVVENENKYRIGKFEVNENMATVTFTGIPSFVNNTICYPALLGLDFYYMYYCRFREMSDVYNRFNKMMKSRKEKVMTLLPVISV